MNDTSRMHKKDPPEDLVDKILDMVVTELLPRIDDPVQIRLHQVSNDVNVSIVGSSLGFENVQQSDYVVVLKKL